MERLSYERTPAMKTADPGHLIVFLHDARHVQPQPTTQLTEILSVYGNVLTVNYSRSSFDADDITWDITYRIAELTNIHTVTFIGSAVGIMLSFDAIINLGSYKTLKVRKFRLGLIKPEEPQEESAWYLRYRTAIRERRWRRYCDHHLAIQVLEEFLSMQPSDLIAEDSNASPLEMADRWGGLFVKMLEAPDFQ